MTEKKQILLALSSEQELGRYARALTEAGYGAGVARDGTSALERAVTEAPSLIIADMDLPVVGPERLLQILKNNPRTSSVPFIFVSDGVSEVKGFRTGLDVFLVRPVNIDELKVKVRRAMASAGGGSAEGREIEGRLTQMSVADILQFMHLNKKEGELKVTSGSSTGVVYIKDGEVFNSILDGCEREKALFRLLAVEDGTFEFTPCRVSITRKVRSSTGNLLMEGMRQLDELKKSRGQLPADDALLRSRVARSKVPGGLQQVIYEIMDLVNDHPMVGDLVERCSAPDFEVYRALSSMMARGILDEETRPSEPGALEEFITRDQAISIREKILTQYSENLNENRGKIMVISTSGPLVRSFTSLCRKVKGLATNMKASFAEGSGENPLGRVANFRLYGGMDLELFSIPSARDMGPLWRAFSTNLIGVVLLWDDRSGKEVRVLAEAKNDLLAAKRVPVVHIYSSDGPADDDSYYRKAFGLKADEPVFTTDMKDPGVASEAFYFFFTRLLKDDYISA